MKTMSHAEFLSDYLAKPENVMAYLNTALEDDDPRMFLLALKHVTRVYGGGMTAVANKTKLGRESLYSVRQTASSDRQHQFPAQRHGIRHRNKNEKNKTEKESGGLSRIVWRDRYSKRWCRREDLNLHVIAVSTAPCV